MSDIEEEVGGELGVKERNELDEPSKYAVVFYNDDYTPMDFVVGLLVKHFHHSEEAATFIMLDVHEKGKGVAGIFTRDIAETKAAFCAHEAKNSGHPLKVDIEKE